MKVLDDLDVTVPVGGSEELRLPGFGTSGYQWFFRVDNNDVVRVRGVPHGPESAGALRVGDSFDDVFIVEAVNAGTASVLFELARPWQRNAVTSRHTVTIRSEPVH